MVEESSAEIGDETQEPDSSGEGGANETPWSAGAFHEGGDQDARERRIWYLLCAGGAIVLVIFLLVFWPVMRGRLEAAKQLDQAQALLKHAQGSVSGVDKIVAQQLSVEPSALAPDVTPQVLVARRELKQIDALIDDAMPHLTEDEQRRAILVRQGADARLAMLDSVPAIIKISAKSARALESANAAWQETLLSNQSEAAANLQYAKQTALGVRTSEDLYARASAQLESANTLYSQAASAFPEAGYVRYTQQGTMHINALKLATSSTTSWLAGERALAKGQHAQYAAQAAAAAAVAKTLPSPPGRAGGIAFEQASGRSRQAYETARAKAVAADEALSTL